jgi:hypothetical protein
MVKQAMLFDYVRISCLLIAAAAYLWEGVHQRHQEEAVELQAAQAGSQLASVQLPKQDKKPYPLHASCHNRQHIHHLSCVLPVAGFAVSLKCLHQINSCQQLTLSSTACTMKSLMPSNTCSAAQAYVSNQRKNSTCTSYPDPSSNI